MQRTTAHIHISRHFAHLRGLPELVKVTAYDTPYDGLVVTRSLEQESRWQAVHAASGYTLGVTWPTRKRAYDALDKAGAAEIDWTRPTPAEFGADKRAREVYHALKDTPYSDF